MLSALANHFLSNDADKHFAHTNLEKADFIFGGTRNTRTRNRIVNEAESRDLNLADLDFSDIEDAEDLHIVGEKIQGKKLLYRHKSFSDLESVDEKIDLLDSLYTLEHDYDVDLVNDPFTSILHNSKLSGNRLISENISDCHDARTVDIYGENNIDGAISYLSDKGPLVGKPDEGSCGDGIQKLESVDEIKRYLSESEEDVVFEEYIPHDQKEHLEDGRAYVVDGNVVAKAGRENDENLATNLAKGGDYIEASELECYEEDAVTAATNSLDFAAVDYVKDLEENEVIIYEVNATPGTNYEDEMEGGLIDPVVNMMEDDEEGVSAEIDTSVNLGSELQHSTV